MAFTPAERSWLTRGRNQSERDLDATMLWAFKEALMKSYGRSIFGWLAAVELHPPGNSGALSWTLSRRLRRELGAAAAAPLVAVAKTFHDYALVAVGCRPEVYDGVWDS
jgi:hypothetical protein